MFQKIEKQGYGKGVQRESGREQVKKEEKMKEDKRELRIIPGSLAK